jgi:glycosyltransferase involved in cell wall biosynthesis
MNPIDAIYAFHHNPLDPTIGIGVRTINILRIMRNLLSSDVTLYTLGNDDKEVILADRITEKHIRNPIGIKAGYLCMFPFLISRQLRQQHLKERAAFIFETPFLGYSLSKAIGIPKDALKIYDAHNVEANYWQPYLSGFKKPLLSRVRNAEQHIVDIADYIFVTSEQERDVFQREYSAQREKLVLVPNGVDTELMQPLTAEQKQTHRDKLGWRYPKYVVFVGSDVKANVEAARWIIDALAIRMPEVCFLIIGSVGRALSARDNVKILGVLPVHEKNLFVAMSDIAINPVLFGAGTNVKMLEYMAAGLPTVTSEIGARGLNLTDGQNVIIADHLHFKKQLLELFNNEPLCRQLATNARAVALKFDWREIELLINQRMGLRKYNA